MENRKKLRQVHCIKNCNLWKAQKPISYRMPTMVFFFRAQKVSLSLTLYNTLEKVFNFLNLKRIQSVLFISVFKEGKKKLIKKHERDLQWLKKNKEEWKRKDIHVCCIWRDCGSLVMDMMWLVFAFMKKTWSSIKSKEILTWKKNNE